MQVVARRFGDMLFSAVVIVADHCGNGLCYMKVSSKLSIMSYNTKIMNDQMKSCIE